MWIGYALACDQPKAVDSITLIEAVIPGLAPPPEIFVPPAENIFLWHFMFNQVPEIQGRERDYLAFMFDKWSFKRDKVAFETYAEAYAAPGALRAGFSYYRAIPETVIQNQRRRAEKLTLPVLAIGAEYATNDAPTSTMRPVASDLRGEIIKGCGHFVPEESPEQLLEHLIPFLRARSL